MKLVDSQTFGLVEDSTFYGCHIDVFERNVFNLLFGKTVEVDCSFGTFANDIFNRNVFDAQSIGFVKVDNKASLKTAIGKISDDGSNIAEVCANKIAKFKK